MHMLWHKTWLETRSRFLIGLALAACSACVTVFTYSKVLELLPLAPPKDVDGELARKIRDAAELVRDYRGYVWLRWFGGNLRDAWTLFAMLLGTGGLLAQATRGGALFTLSLPVPRSRILAVRAAVGFGELVALGFVPSLLVVALSPAVGQRYSVGDAL